MPAARPCWDSLTHARSARPSPPSDLAWRFRQLLHNLPKPSLTFSHSSYPCLVLNCEKDLKRKHVRKHPRCPQCSLHRSAGILPCFVYSLSCVASALCMPQNWQVVKSCQAFARTAGCHLSPSSRPVLARRF